MEAFTHSPRTPAIRLSSSQLHNRDTVAPFCSIARPECHDVGRGFQILAQCCPEPSGAMPVNDAHKGASTQDRTIQPGHHDIQRIIRRLAAHIERFLNILGRQRLATSPQWCGDNFARFVSRRLCRACDPRQTGDGSEDFSLSDFQPHPLFSLGAFEQRPCHAQPDDLNRISDRQLLHRNRFMRFTHLAPDFLLQFDKPDFGFLRFEQFLVTLQVIKRGLNRRPGTLKFLGQFLLEPQPLIPFRFLHEGQQFLGFSRGLFGSLLRQTGGSHVVTQPPLFVLQIVQQSFEQPVVSLQTRTGILQ